MAMDSSKYIYVCVSMCVYLKWKSTVSKRQLSQQKKKTVSCALFNIIYFLYKSFVQNNFFFSLFSVFKRFKKEEDKIRIKILCSTLIVPFHVLPITIFHTFFFSSNQNYFLKKRNQN